MDFNLSEQEKMLQSVTKDFAAKSVQPRASDIDASDRFPSDLISEMGGLRYQGLPYPVEYGGSGAGYTEYALVLEQICQASMTAGAMLSLNIVPEEAISRFGSQSRRRLF